eukprot:2165887-Amphidinium_carterae.1
MDDMPEDLAHLSVDVESPDEHADEEAGQASTAAGSEGTGGASSEALNRWGVTSGTRRFLSIATTNFDDEFCRRI